MTWTSQVDVVGLLRRSLEVDLAGADVGAVRAMLADLGRVQSRIDARQVEARRRLDDLARSGAAGDPDREIARASNTTARAAAQNADRDTTLALVPEMEDALNDGDISGAHVDALARGLRRLEPADRKTLVDGEGARLARLAKRQSPDEYAMTVRVAVADAQSDGGIANLERQRRATLLRCWTDQITGMLELRGSFDPESGLKLTGRLRRLVDELFAAQTPDTCPDDPSLEQDHLRALALIALIDGNTAPTGPRGDAPASDAAATANTNAAGPVGHVPRAAAPDMIVVVPLSVLRKGRADGELVDLGDPDAVLPIETLRRLACTANIIPAVLGSDGVIRDLGRGSRLATKEQRRALRAMYPSCGVHGCRVPFERCDIHHIRYWEHDGPTDEANLLPLCSKHHHAVHEGGWQLALHPTTRVLTVTYPDGTVEAHAPPRARPGSSSGVRAGQGALVVTRSRGR